MHPSDLSTDWLPHPHCLVPSAVQLADCTSAICLCFIAVMFSTSQPDLRNTQWRKVTQMLATQLSSVWWPGAHFQRIVMGHILCPRKVILSLNTGTPVQRADTKDFWSRKSEQNQINRLQHVNTCTSTLAIKCYGHFSHVFCISISWFPPPLCILPPALLLGHMSAICLYLSSCHALISYLTTWVSL